MSEIDEFISVALSGTATMTKPNQAIHTSNLIWIVEELKLDIRKLRYKLISKIPILTIFWIIIQHSPDIDLNILLSDIDVRTTLDSITLERIVSALNGINSDIYRSTIEQLRNSVWLLFVKHISYTLNTTFPSTTTDSISRGIIKARCGSSISGMYGSVVDSNTLGQFRTKYGHELNISKHDICQVIGDIDILQHEKTAKIINECIDILGENDARTIVFNNKEDSDNAYSSAAEFAKAVDEWDDASNYFIKGDSTLDITPVSRLHTAAIRAQDAARKCKVAIRKADIIQRIKQGDSVSIKERVESWFM